MSEQVEKYLHDILMENINKAQPELSKRYFVIDFEKNNLKIRGKTGKETIINMGKKLSNTDTQINVKQFLAELDSNCQSDFRITFFENKSAKTCIGTAFFNLSEDKLQKVIDEKGNESYFSKFLNREHALFYADTSLAGSTELTFKIKKYEIVFVGEVEMNEDGTPFQREIEIDISSLASHKINHNETIFTKYLSKIYPSIAIHFDKKLDGTILGVIKVNDPEFLLKNLSQESFDKFRDKFVREQQQKINKSLGIER